MSNDMAKDVFSGIQSVTKKWKAAKRQADKEDRLSRRQLSYLRYKPRSISIKEAAYGAMEEAYNVVSSNGKYYANARQLMYKVRPTVISTCDKAWKNSSYFTQTLLKDYLEEHAPPWKVIWDARGHIKEPHTDNEIKLGGVEVIKYVEKWKNTFDIFPRIEFDDLIGTKGPINRYGSVLFIEKEGFNEVLEESKISKEFDIAMMSTKGLPVGAACELANALHRKGVKIFVLHDFDFAGFKIVNTLRNGTRLAPATPSVIDLGFRFEDVKDLETEDVSYNQHKDPRIKLREYGTTEEEQNFLVEVREDEYRYSSWIGKRVELNVLTSEEFIEFIRGKLTEHGVEKVIPDDDVLEEAYKRAVYGQRILEKVDEISGDMQEDIDIPNNLREQLSKEIEKSKKSAWDEVIWDIAETTETNEEENK